MAEEFKKSWFENIFSSSMGPGNASDSGLSSWDSFSQEFDQISSSIPPICQKPQLLSQTRVLSNFSLKGKEDYLRKVVCHIERTKETFQKNFTQSNQRIEEMTRYIVYSAKAREKQLKAQLQEIGRAKILEWDRQLAMCEASLARLRSTEDCSDYMFDVILYDKPIEFVESGDIQFEMGDLKVLDELKTIGKISYANGKALKSISENASDSLKIRCCFTPKFIIGCGGGKSGEFCRPWGICSDPMGRFLVCDRSNHRIQIFEESGKFILQFGKEGAGPGEFSRPAGIAVDKNCRIIVADKDNHRIQVFTYSGHFLFSFGSHGSKPGQFSYPWDVAVNYKCDIAVSDSKNHRVQLFNERGIFLALFDWKKLGIRDYRLGLRQLDCPRGLAFRPDGSLLVTDFNNHRVCVINASFTKMTVFGREGGDPGQFLRPQGIACEGFGGRLAVADSKNYRIQIFDSTNKLVKVFGIEGIAPGEFDCPQGICFHPNGSIAVVDLNNNRVQVF